MKHITKTSPITSEEVSRFILEANPNIFPPRLTDYTINIPTVLLTSAAIGWFCLNQVGKLINANSEQIDSSPVEKSLITSISALAGCTLVLGKYLTPAKYGKFLFRSDDFRITAGETLIGAMLGYCIAGSSFAVLDSYNRGIFSSFDSSFYAAFGTLSAALCTYVGYKCFLDSPFQKALLTIKKMGKNISIYFKS